MIKKDTLIFINSRNKIQVLEIFLILNKEEYIIKRITYQLFGVKSNQPDIKILKAKQKRNLLEQAELEYKSKLKNYLDKGYKNLLDFSIKSIEDLSEKELLEFIGSHKSNSFGVPKPMLAQQHEKCNKQDFEKTWLASKKLDGIRCLIGLDKSNNIFAMSRNGIEYTVPTTKIREDKSLIKFLLANPDLILDGELYNKKLSLQELSGIARLKDYEDKCDLLEYHIYDIISNKPFKDRLIILDSLESNNLIKVISHKEVSGWDSIKTLHDSFVNEGYEGLVLRAPDKEYGIGKRSGSYMIKIKDYNDLDAKVINYKLGLRGIEDVVFICQLDSGIEFDAKPIGSLEIKKEYIDSCIH